MYVVAGVTGHTGAVVANTLLDQGKKVRVLVRSADKGAAFAARGAEVAIVSLDDSAALTKALAGATGAYLLVPPDHTSEEVIARGHRIVDAITTAVKAAKVPHVVFLSSIGAQHEKGTGPITQLHYAEKQLAGVTQATFLRPGYFFENLLNMLGAIKGQGVLPVFADPDFAFPMLATVDIGRAAVAALLDPPGPGHQSRVLELNGPKSRTLSEAAAAFAKALDKPVHVVRVPDEGAIPAMRGAGMSADLARLYLEMNHAVGQGLFAFDGHKLVTGTTTLETFVDQAVRS